jgi:hypothetical protein
MPTDKHRIAAYVPQSVYVRFEAFKQERLLNDSQAINAILAEFLAVNPDDAQREPLTIDKLRSELFDALDNAVMDIRRDLFGELKSKSLPKSLSESVSSLPIESLSESTSEPLIKPDAMPSGEPSSESVSSLPIESLSESTSEPLIKPDAMPSGEPSSESHSSLSIEPTGELTSDTLIEPDSESLSKPLADSSEGLSDEQMANALSVEVGTVRRWRKGERKPSKANADLFDRWEVRGNRWYEITTNSGDD